MVTYREPKKKVAMTITIHIDQHKTYHNWERTITNISRSGLLGSIFKEDVINNSGDDKQHGYHTSEDEVLGLRLVVDFQGIFISLGCCLIFTEII